MSEQPHLPLREELTGRLICPVCTVMEERIVAGHLVRMWWAEGDCPGLDDAAATTRCCKPSAAPMTDPVDDRSVGAKIWDTVTEQELRDGDRIVNTRPDPVDAAVTAAAEAMEDAAMRWLGRDLGTLHRDDIARAGLAAAVPLILDQLADEIEASVNDVKLTGDHSAGYVQGALRAASGIRAARDRWTA